jgi:hypothetical protein
MYNKLVAATGTAAAPGLALTGMNLLYAGLVAFVLTGAAFALGRILPWRTS